MSELKTRVEELKMENEYQLRLKDMNYNEKIKELTEKFIQVRDMIIRPSCAFLTFIKSLGNGKFKNKEPSFKN